MVSCSKTLLFLAEESQGDAQQKSHESHADPGNHDNTRAPCCLGAGKSEQIWFSRSLPLASSGPAVSAGTVGPLSLGEGELICTVAPRGVENLDVAAPAEIRGPSRHPASVAGFGSDRCCVTVLPSASQAESICDFSEEGAVEDYLMPAGPATTSGVTEVVAMAEVSVTHSLCINSD